MRQSVTRTSVGLVFALLGTLAAGCAEEYRQIVVVDGGSTEFVTFGRAPQGQQEVWVPGRVLAVRSDGPLPGHPHNATATAGRIYRIQDDLRLEEVGEFELTIPNDTLAYQFGR